ncbi:MAG: VWA domain-containing protein [Planctomycetes bacterium]|nr:VWA domain-containing protein [Planctomycetota bacterium]
MLVAMALSPCYAAGLLKPIEGGDENDVYMKSHHVNVVINNGFARTEVDQVFANQGGTDMHAIYTFPVPKQASLSEVSLWIDGNEVIGEVLEKERARKIHEEQIQKGNDTALAEKDDYKTFEISVYPVRANAETRIRLVYYQPIEIDLNIGRYVYPLEEGGVDEERIAFWSVDDKVRESFSFNLELKSAFPVKDIRLPGHLNQAIVEKVQGGDENVDVNEERESGSLSGEIYNIRIDSPQGDALTRDIVMYYRLVDDVPARVELVTYRKDAASTGTLMVVVTPAADLQRISEGVDWTFVLDVSGSMSGGKIATLCDGVSKVIGKMSPQDRYRIITFSNTASDFTGGYITATPANVQSTLRQVKKITSGGGTNLFAGLKMAYDKLDDDRTTGIILVTDGVANVGKTEHRHFINLLKQYDLRLFTFIIGNSANQPLMDRLALESGGFAMNISTGDDIIGRIVQAESKILFENLHDVEFKFHGEKVKNLTPQKPGNLYQGQQLIMFGQFDGVGEVELELTAKISGVDRSWKCSAYLPESDTDNPELERMWALSKIENIMQEIRDNGDKTSLRKKVVALGKEYSLVTDYTSMLVVSVVEMEEQAIQRKNADRVNTERKAQQRKANQPVKSYRVDNSRKNSQRNQPMFNNRRSPGVGSGPVGPLFLAGVYWICRRKRGRK